MTKTIIIFGGARDFHAVDWYRVIKLLLKDNEVRFLTDNIAGEGMPNLLNKYENFDKLFIIDPFLLKSQSLFCNLWRNFLKLILIPFQVLKLRLYLKSIPNPIVHAHPMYYMLLCSLAGADYIGTPQGSELLLRCKRSFFYRLISKTVLLGAKCVTVDSHQMADAVKLYSGRKALLVQNGIDTTLIEKYRSKSCKRNLITSIRGVTHLYRIKEILKTRNQKNPDISINFVYPFHDDVYLSNMKNYSINLDIFFGRLEKQKYYKLLSETMLVISIPKSDSSPRSVYEAIFIGCFVATTYNKWIDTLTPSMKKRVLIVDLSNPNWLNESIKTAKKNIHIRYIPDKESVQQYDQFKSLSRVTDILYQ